MPLHLEDKWVWDFWFARDGMDYHIFYLQAPRALKDPDIRHWHSSIGHAVSQDLTHWEILPDALIPSNDENAWDNLTTWTGSTLRHNNKWYMFYTGTNRSENGLIQRIGLATSNDLIKWTKYADNPVIDIDPNWYELFDKNLWYEQTWRDPWVFEQNSKFYALMTARSKLGEPKGRGVISFATSDDLFHWEVGAPITEPGEFAYLEVPQIVKINRRYYLFFCVGHEKYSKQRNARKGVKACTGTHYMVSNYPFGPFTQPANDVLYGDEQGSSYSGKLIQDNTGEWKFMTVIQYDSSKQYIGDISDPMPIIIKKNGDIIVQGKSFQ